MATIAIFDDDVQSVATLRTLIQELAPLGTSNTILEATSYDELTALLDSGVHIDILIADVVMPEGEPSGVDVVERLFPPESGTQVIFVSGYLEQATEVYVTNHLYFLLKPIDPEKLSDALDKAFAALEKRRPSMLRIKVGHKERLINVSSISYLESSLHKVSVHTRTGVFETYAKLDDLQAQLPTSFTRCHRSFLVNLAYVTSVDEGELRLYDGTVVPVSRRRAKQMQRSMLAYLASRS